MNKSNYLLLLCVFLFSCAEESRNNELNQVLKKEVDSLSNHLFEFVDFKKIDGVEVRSGSLKYEMDFEGFISAKEDCIWTGEVYEGNYTTGYDSGLKGAVQSQDNTHKHFLKKGYGYDAKGKAFFEKRDSGWKLQYFTLLTY